MSPRPGTALRRQVFDRAGVSIVWFINRIPVLRFISTTSLQRNMADRPPPDNLALSCMPCNRRKGSDISSIDPITGKTTPFFNPRIQDWSSHFSLNGVEIIGLAPEGRATVHLLQLNADERLLEREELIAAGHYTVPVR